MKYTLIAICLLALTQGFSQVDPEIKWSKDTAQFSFERGQSTWVELVIDPKPQDSRFITRLQLDSTGTRVWKVAIGDGSMKYVATMDSTGNIYVYDSTIAISQMFLGIKYMYEQQEKLRHEIDLMENIIKHIKTNGFIADLQSFEKAAKAYIRYKQY